MLFYNNKYSKNTLNIYLNQAIMIHGKGGIMARGEIILEKPDLNIKKIEEICGDGKKHYGEITKEGRGCEGPLYVYFYIKEKILYGRIADINLPFREIDLENTKKILIKL